MTAPLVANGAAIRSSGRSPRLGLHRPRNHSACAPTAPAGLESTVRGTLDEDPGLHQLTAHAAAWAPLPDDGLPRLPERFAPGASPLDQ